MSGYVSYVWNYNLRNLWREEEEVTFPVTSKEIVRAFRCKDVVKGSVSEGIGRQTIKIIREGGDFALEVKVNGEADDYVYLHAVSEKYQGDIS